MKLWRNTIQETSLGANCIYPRQIGRYITPKIPASIRDTSTFNTVVGYYDREYQALLGTVNLGDEQIDNILDMLKIISYTLAVTDP